MDTIGRTTHREVGEASNLRVGRMEAVGSTTLLGLDNTPMALRAPLAARRRSETTRVLQALHRLHTPPCQSLVTEEAMVALMPTL
jgi:hypothetical protein